MLCENVCFDRNRETNSIFSIHCRMLSIMNASDGNGTVQTGKKQLAIHRIRELQLDYVDIASNYDVLKEIGSGDYGKVILAIHKRSHIEVSDAETVGCL